MTERWFSPVLPIRWRLPADWHPSKPLCDVAFTFHGHFKPDAPANAGARIAVSQ